MRFFSKSVLLSGVLFTSHVICVQAIPLVRDEVTTQKITTPLNTASLDDYLIDIARAAKINVFADATAFPTQSVVKPYPSTPGAIEGLQGQYKDKWDQILLNMMGDVVAQKKLSTLRSDDRTFLFWNEPDPHQLAVLQWAVTIATEKARFDEAIAAAKAAQVPENEVISGELSETQLHKLLRTYLKDGQGWAGSPAERVKPVDFETHFEELPPDLRAVTWLTLRQRFVKQGYDFLQDDFWNNIDARLRIEKKGDISKLVGRYTVTKPDGTKTPDYFEVAVVNLDAPAQTVTQAAAPELDPKLAPELEEPTTPVTLGPEDSLSNAYSGITDDASAPELAADTSLGKTISLELKRSTLRDLLSEVAKKSGVELKLGTNAPGEKLITAYVQDMPLSHLMGVLSRVYGVKWSKEEGTYVMKGNDQGQLHLMLLQVGDPQQYRYRFMIFNRVDRLNEPNAIAQAILQQVGKEALLAPEGVPVTSLLPALQHRLRHGLEDSYDEFQAVRLYNTNRLLVDQIAKKGLVLRFGNAIAESYRAPTMAWDQMKMPNLLCFNVQTDDQQIVLPIFESFNMEVPKKAPANIPVPSRRR